MSTTTIIILIIVALIFAPLLWNIAKGLAKLLLIVLLVLGAIYIFSPETLDNWFGSENVEKVENKVSDTGKKAVAELDTVVTEIKKNDSIKKVKEKIDSLAND
jgi:c-di-AMP phosphodiesterase-like protein